MRCKHKPEPKLPAPWEGLGLEIDDELEVQWVVECHQPEATVLYTTDDGSVFVRTRDGVPSFPLVEGDIIIKLKRARS